MDADIIRQYESRICDLEEPIREIVPALWPLPFVLDTGETCSGHMLAQYDMSMVEYPYIEGYSFLGSNTRYAWYPHRAMLELAFSLDKDLSEARDKFRKDLSEVMVIQDGLKISFDNIRASNQETIPYSRIKQPNLTESYNATLPFDEEKPEPYETVLFVESLLASFWEKVAIVVRNHNPKAEIESITGKSFRKVSDWVKWPRKN